MELLWIKKNNENKYQRSVLSLIGYNVIKVWYIGK